MSGGARKVIALRLSDAEMSRLAEHGRRPRDAVLELLDRSDRLAELEALPMPRKKRPAKRALAEARKSAAVRAAPTMTTGMQGATSTRQQGAVVYEVPDPAGGRPYRTTNRAFAQARANETGQTIQETR